MIPQHTSASDLTAQSTVAELNQQTTAFATMPPAAEALYPAAASMGFAMAPQPYPVYQHVPAAMYHPAMFAADPSQSYNWSPHGGAMLHPGGVMAPATHAPMFMAPAFPGHMPHAGGYMYPSPYGPMMPMQPIYMMPQPISAQPSRNLNGSGEIPAPSNTGSPPAAERGQARSPDGTDALPEKLELARFLDGTQQPQQAGAPNIAGGDNSMATLGASLSQHNASAVLALHSPPAIIHSISRLSESAAFNDTSNSALLAALPPTFLHPVPSSSAPHHAMTFPQTRHHQPPAPQQRNPKPASAAHGEPHGQLMVCYLDVSVNAQELSGLFSRFGVLNGAKIVYDVNNQSRCYGFVYFRNHEDAKLAVEKMDGYRYREKNLRVHFSDRPNQVFTR